MGIVHRDAHIVGDRTHKSREHDCTHTVVKTVLFLTLHRLDVNKKNARMLLIKLSER